MHIYKLSMLTKFDQEEKLRIRMGIDLVDIENDKDKVKANYNSSYFRIINHIKSRNKNV